ncbi:MAG: zinc ribbon domain-containing protein [Firmicutes bacterium]|nr:zinc ribbon domain-containing protein [Bacillota bacterium]
MFCTNCGKKLHDGDKFCANCGTKVRKDTPEIKPVSNDIVFNPPFKVEAEKRTSEIYRGFVSDKPAEEKKRTAEPVNFDWNLSGFPQETRKTDDVDFNWDSVVERRNQQRREETRQEYRQDVPAPVVDKIDLHEAEKHAPQKEEAVPLTEEDILAALSVSGRVRTPLYNGPLVEPAKAAAEMFAEPVWEPVNVAMERAAAEPKKPAAEPVPEPVEEEETEAEATASAVTVDTFDLSELGLITEIPELILPDDPEEPKPVCEEEPAEVPAEEAAEPEAEPVTEPEAEPAADEPAMTIEELEAELFGNHYKGLGSMAPEEAVKSTAQLEKFYTYNKKNEEFQQLLDQEYERLRGMESARRADTESLEFTWARTLFPERKDEIAAEPEAAKPEETPAEAAPAEEVQPAEEKQPVSDATLDFSAVREEARMKKKLEAEKQEAVAAEEVQPAEEPEAAAESAPEPVAEPEVSEPAETAPEAEEEPAAEAEAEPVTPSEETAEEDGHDEKARLRYSDIFPRENPDDDSNAGNGDLSGTAAKVSEVFDEYDEDDEPKKMNIIVKLILLILILLILAEGVVLLAKFIAPDSAFSQKADEVVEMLMDRITGGDGKTDGDDEGEGSLPVSGDDPEATYISDILAEKIELPDTIGEVLEDPALKYDAESEYAFDEIPDAKILEESEWKTGDNEEPVTYAEGILTAIVDYYAQWQATNKDTSLIGINKLEIGEIRTGEKGYYTLCRLTFAGADGDEVVKYVTACVKISQDSMVNNKIEEEKL